VSEKGLKASFLDRHAVLQQVLNTMAAIHNGGNDKSLWGCFMGKWRKKRERERERERERAHCLYTLECQFIVNHIHRGVDHITIIA
jgi:hypothetical protein